MLYKGHVEDGTVVLDEPAGLPEGALVTVSLVVPEHTTEKTLPPPLAERLASVIGKAEGVPADWAEEHDKYLSEGHGL